METLAAFLASQPLLALFLVIGLGYALGEVSLGGLALGVGAVLFVGLAVGALVPGARPPPLLGLLGLVMFLYGIGIQYGRQFVAGLTGAAGRRANLLALLGLAAGVVMALASIGAGLPTTYVTGLFAGAMTRHRGTPGRDRGVGLAEPGRRLQCGLPDRGDLRPILCMYLFQALLRPKVEAPGLPGLSYAEIAVRNPEVADRTLAELAARAACGRSWSPPSASSTATSCRATSSSCTRTTCSLSRPSPRPSWRPLAAWWASWRPCAWSRTAPTSTICASSPPGGAWSGSGSPLSRCPAAPATRSSVSRRGDTELLPRPDLILEFGDRVGLLCPREHHRAVRAYFGNSIRGTAEFSYVSVGIGMATGSDRRTGAVACSGYRHPLTRFRGRPARGGPYSGLSRPYHGAGLDHAGLRQPDFAAISALPLFLAQVGISSGLRFVTTVQETGFLLLAWSAAILLAVVLTTLLVGHVLKIAYDELLGIASGGTGNPAILAYASRAVPTDRPDIGYALIFPGATLVKIVVVNVLTALFLK